MDIVVPVQRDDPRIAERIRALHGRIPLSWSITIVNMAGTGDTWRWGARLTAQLPGVHTVLVRHGWAGAVHAVAWRHTRADIVVLLDLAVPAALDALAPLVTPLSSGRAALTVGTVRGGPSGPAGRAYAGMLRRGFGIGDTRCGLVAARTDVLRPLLTRINDDVRFLGTELVLLARHNRLPVHEVPIAAPPRPQPGWEHLAALVRVTYAIVTSQADLHGLPRATAPVPAPPAVTLMKFVLFGIVGVLSGVLYIPVYLAFRELSPAAVANFAALAAVALFNIESNRAWTFRRSKVARLGMHVRSGVLFLIHYVLTTGAVVGLLAIDPDPGRTAELVTLFAADLLMTLARFVGLETWVFRRGLK